MNDTITLYRPTGPDELTLVRKASFKRWPPRLPEQPIFYPVTNERYATQIASEWNVSQSGSGYVTRFEVRKSFMDRYAIQQVGAAHHTEWWVPAEDLEELNDNIVGAIEVIAEFHATGQATQAGSEQLQPPQSHRKSEASFRTTADLIDAIDRGARPKFLLFWGHQPSKDGSIGKTCFSQWFEAAFVVNDVGYRTAEHFMMAEKARLFGDEATRERVLAAATPAQAKKLGRLVSGFNEERWVATRFDIVVQANLAKFSQNEALREFLMNTGDHVIVEASPVDKIWGIGLAADSPHAQAPSKWEGLNLLGFALMEVRDALREPTSPNNKE